MPSFLRLTERKQIVDLILDETRNILYSHAFSDEHDTLGQGVIEVFDLGIQANQFQRVCTIRQYQLVKAILDFWREDKAAIDLVD